MKWDDLQFYVYALLDPRKPGKYVYGDLELDYEPFYVGKGLGCRVIMHTWGSTNEEKFLSGSNKLKAKRILEILKDPEVEYTYKILKQGLAEDEAFKWEKYYVDLVGRFIKQEGPLLNLSKGGEGLDHISPKHRTSSFLGKHHSQETKDKISKANKGKRAWNKGTPRTEEVKSKLRKPHPTTQGSNNPSKREGVRKKISESKLGSNNPRSKEWIITDGENVWVFKGGANAWCKEHHTTLPSLKKGKSKQYKLIKEAEIVYYKGKIFRN